MMMDNDIDMDDLFGDGRDGGVFGDAAPLSLPSPPTSKALLRRLDETRLSGCCQ